MEDGRVTLAADPEQLRKARAVMIATVSARLAVKSGMNAGAAVSLLEATGELHDAAGDPMATGLVVTEFAGLVISLLQVISDHGDDSLDECWRIVCRQYARDAEAR